MSLPLGVLSPKPNNVPYFAKHQTMPLQDSTNIYQRTPEPQKGKQLRGYTTPSRSVTRNAQSRRRKSSPSFVPPMSVFASRTPKVKKYIKEFREKQELQREEEEFLHSLRQEQSSDAVYNPTQVNGPATFIPPESPYPISSSSENQQNRRKSVRLRRQSLGRGNIILGGPDITQAVFVQNDSLMGSFGGDLPSSTNDNRGVSINMLRQLSRALERERQKVQRLEAIRKKLREENEDEGIEILMKEEVQLDENQVKDSGGRGVKRLSGTRDEGRFLKKLRESIGEQDDIPTQNDESAAHFSQPLEYTEDQPVSPLIPKSSSSKIIEPISPSSVLDSGGRKKSEEFFRRIDGEWDQGVSGIKIDDRDMSREVEIRRDDQARLSLGRSRLSEAFPEFNTTQTYDGDDSKSFNVENILHGFFKTSQNETDRDVRTADSDLSILKRKESDKFVIEIDENFPMDMGSAGNGSIGTDIRTSSRSAVDESVDHGSVEDAEMDEGYTDEEDHRRLLTDREIYENQRDDGVDLHAAGAYSSDEENGRPDTDFDNNLGDSTGLDLNFSLNLDDMENPESEDRHSESNFNITVDNEQILRDSADFEYDDPANVNLSIDNTTEARVSATLIKDRIGRSGTVITGIHRRRAPPSTIPQNVIKDLAASMVLSKRKLEIPALHRIMEASEAFFEQMGLDLAADLQKANRKRIEESDVLHLMSRQRGLLKQLDQNSSDSNRKDVRETKNGLGSVASKGNVHNEQERFRSWKSGRDIRSYIQKHRSVRDGAGADAVSLHEMAVKYLPQETVEEIFEALDSSKAKKQRNNRQQKKKEASSVPSRRYDSPSMNNGSTPVHTFVSESEDDNDDENNDHDSDY